MTYLKSSEKFASASYVRTTGMEAVYNRTWLVLQKSKKITGFVWTFYLKVILSIVEHCL